MPDQARALQGAPAGVARYAVYCTPDHGSPLARFGVGWFATNPPPAVPGLGRARVEALLAPARLYGFHATLMAPFSLAPGVEPGDLIRALDRFAAARVPVVAPPLYPTTLGAFVALRPRGVCPALDDLAAECVRRLDGFRASSDTDMARRRGAGLTPRQEALLQTWGYPYVMEEYRCHMTLAGPAMAHEVSMLLAAAASRFSELRDEPLVIDAISLVAQPSRDAPFNIVQRFSLAAAA